MIEIDRRYCFESERPLQRGQSMPAMSSREDPGNPTAGTDLVERHGARYFGDEIAYEQVTCPKRVNGLAEKRPLAFAP